MEAEGINPQPRSRRAGSAALAETKEIPLDRIKGTPVQVDGEAVIVGKLSLNQLVAVARQGLNAIITMSPEQRKQIAEAGINADVGVILALLDERTINGAFSVILNRSEEWCGEHMDALAALEIADAVLDHNSWEQLQAVFLRLQKRFKPSVTNSA